MANYLNFEVAKRLLWRQHVAHKVENVSRGEETSSETFYTGAKYPDNDGGRGGHDTAQRSH